MVSVVYIQVNQECEVDISISTSFALPRPAPPPKLNLIQLEEGRNLIGNESKTTAKRWHTTVEHNLVGKSSMGYN